MNISPPNNVSIPRDPGAVINPVAIMVPQLS